MAKVRVSYRFASDSYFVDDGKKYVEVRNVDREEAEKIGRDRLAKGEGDSVEEYNRAAMRAQHEERMRKSYMRAQHEVRTGKFYGF